MNILTKSLLYYSFFLLLAFFVVGIVTSRNGDNVIVHVFYLPILLYLAYVTINKKETIIREKKDSAYMLVILLFVVFFLIGVFNVYRFNKNLSVEETDQTSNSIIIQNHEKNP